MPSNAHTRFPLPWKLEIFSRRFLNYFCFFPVYSTSNFSSLFNFHSLFLSLHLFHVIYLFTASLCHFISLFIYCLIVLVFPAITLHKLLLFLKEKSAGKLQCLYINLTFLFPLLCSNHCLPTNRAILLTFFSSLLPSNALFHLLISFCFHLLLLESSIIMRKGIRETTEVGGFFQGQFFKF